MESIKLPGFLITIEGIEGSGKTSLARLLFDKLKSEGYNAIFAAEPGGDSISQSIRDLLLKSSGSMDAKTELFLFLASRAQLVSHIIIPHIRTGGIVICDRFTDSTLAYQGYGRGFNLAWLRQMNEFATDGLLPELTILLDLPVEIGLKRQQSIDRIGGETSSFHEAVRNGFLRLAREEPNRFLIIDATKSTQFIFETALAEIHRRFEKLKGVLE